MNKYLILQEQEGDWITYTAFATNKAVLEEEIKEQLQNEKSTEFILSEEETQSLIRLLGDWIQRSPQTSSKKGIF